MKRVYDFIKGCGIYYLATVDGNEPKIRPFGTIDIFEDKLYIQTGKCKPIYRQLLDNPNVELCACKDNRWIRVSGKLVPDDRREPKKHMLDEYPELRNMYSEDDDNTIVFYFEKGKAVISSFTEPPVEIEF